MARDYMRLGDVADYLKLPKETVYKYARTGKLPASKIGRHWRFDRAMIDEWVRHELNVAKNPLRALVVDDEKIVRDLFARWLTEFGCEVYDADGATNALVLLKNTNVDVIFLDLNMPEMDGAELLARIKAAGVKAEVVIVTAFFDSEVMDRALEHGSLRLLKKPVSREKFIEMVDLISTKRVD